MEKLIDTLKDRMGSLALPGAIFVAILTGMLLPAPASAEDEFALDRGRLGGDRLEGDPLDGNEPDGDPTDGQDVHDTLGKLGSGLDALRWIIPSDRVLLLPQYNGSFLTFKIIILSEAVAGVEQGYAK